MQIYGQEMLKIHFCMQWFHPWGLIWLGSTNHYPSGKYKSVSLCFSNLKSNFYNSSFQQLYGKEI